MCPGIKKAAWAVLDNFLGLLLTLQRVHLRVHLLQQTRAHRLRRPSSLEDFAYSLSAFVWKGAE